MPDAHRDSTVNYPILRRSKTTTNDLSQNYALSAYLSAHRLHANWGRKNNDLPGHELHPVASVIFDGFIRESQKCLTQQDFIMKFSAVLLSASLAFATPCVVFASDDDRPDHFKGEPAETL